MLFKHSRKKSAEDILTAKKKSRKSLITQEKSKKLKPKTIKKLKNIKIPRTCVDSPINSKSRPSSKRLSYCETYKAFPSQKTLTSKKLKSKIKLMTKKPDFTLKPNKPEKRAISPISKNPFEVTSSEDQTIVKVLEILKL